jgi:hypothetical protein
MYEPTTNAVSNRSALVLVLAMVGLTACGGGGQQPAESPEAVAPTAPPAEAPTNDASGVPEGEHTMPDGTKMKGPEHGAGSDEHKH